jgi:hypothetical protein
MGRFVAGTKIRQLFTALQNYDTFDRNVFSGAMYTSWMSPGGVEAERAIYMEAANRLGEIQSLAERIIADLDRHVDPYNDFLKRKCGQVRLAAIEDARDVARHLAHLDGVILQIRDLFAGTPDEAKYRTAKALGLVQFVPGSWWASKNYPNHNSEMMIKVAGQSWAIVHVKWNDKNGPTTANVMMGTLKARDGQSIPGGNLWGGGLTDAVNAALEYAGSAPAAGAAVWNQLTAPPFSFNVAMT